MDVHLENTTVQKSANVNARKNHQETAAEQINIGTMTSAAVSVIRRRSAMMEPLSAQQPVTANATIHQPVHVQRVNTSTKHLAHTNASRSSHLADVQLSAKISNGTIATVNARSQKFQLQLEKFGMRAFVISSVTIHQIALAIRH